MDNSAQVYVDYGGHSGTPFTASNLRINFHSELSNSSKPLFGGFAEETHGAAKIWQQSIITTEEATDHVLEIMREFELGPPLDDGEKLVARVLGHEYVAREYVSLGVCSCGLEVGRPSDFRIHVRKVIEEAESELP